MEGPNQQLGKRVSLGLALFPSRIDRLAAQWPAWIVSQSPETAGRKARRFRSPLHGGDSHAAGRAQPAAVGAFKVMCLLVRANAGRSSNPRRQLLQVCCDGNRFWV